jgi:hypothetical protein
MAVYKLNKLATDAEVSLGRGVLAKQLLLLLLKEETDKDPRRQKSE